MGASAGMFTGAAGSSQNLSCGRQVNWPTVSPSGRLMDTVSGCGARTTAIRVAGQGRRLEGSPGRYRSRPDQAKIFDVARQVAARVELRQVQRRVGQVDQADLAGAWAGALAPARHHHLGAGRRLVKQATPSLSASAVATALPFWSTRSTLRALRPACRWPAGHEGISSPSRRRAARTPYQ